VAHQVKVTGAEEAVLVRLAEAAGVSVPRLLVEAATAAEFGSGGVTATQRREAVVELLTVSRVLAGVAGNLNQLARAVNAGAEFPPQAVAVREKIRERIARACAGLSDPGNRAPLRPPPGRPGGGGLGVYRGPERAPETSPGVGS